MRIVCTGISGSGASEYLSNVLKVREIKIFDVGETMFEIAEKQGMPIKKTKILDKPDTELAPLRAAAFEKILGEAQNFEDSIIRTHTCFRWKKHLRKAFDFHYLKELNPDKFVTIIDSVASIKRRLEQNPQWKGRLSIKEILIWQNEETFLTELMADYQQKKFYIMPNKILVNSFLKLLFDEKIPRIYTSYPISNVTERDKWIKKKDLMCDKLRRFSIVFDPLDVEDMELFIEAKKASDIGRDIFTTNIGGSPAEINTNEVSEAKDEIFSHTVARDFKLIDQSDMVVVLYPESVRSQGVANEIIYASASKDVYLVTPLSEDPFTEYNITQRFKSVDDLLKYLHNRERQHQ
ncbi:MAG: AAA family ATPase [Candidatus Bathyarchaeota archaeon]|nr:AAA family ATPase [Candidatus Bathyarchaeota archaeon]